MNHLVEIKYSKSGKYPKIFINGEAISRYMSLSDYIYDDIFCWAEDFFDIMDSELAEEYSVSLIGHQYHEIVLREAMKKSEYCRKIFFEENEYRISVEDKYRYILELNKTHSLVSERLEPYVEFACAAPEAFESYCLSELRFASNDSDYSICTEGEDVSALSGKYRVVVGDADRVVRQRDVSYLYVTKEHLPVLIDYLNTYHLRLTAIETIFSKLSERSFDELTMLEFDAYNREEYRVYVGKLPTLLESGMTFEVEHQYFPKCFEDPKIKLMTSDPNVISYENGSWTAKEPGICTVCVTDATGKVYASAEVEVFRHNYVTNIAITLPATTMQIGETLSFSTVITPVDAEDIGEIAYSVSDEGIAVLTGQNQLYSLSAGRVCVTASTPRIERKFYITVLPQPTGLNVSGESVELPHPAEATIHCSVVPANVAQSTTVSWAVSNKDVIRIKGSNSKKCCIESVGEGTAVLMCRINGTNIARRINVTVTKKKGCYVATSVYGSYDCPEVWVLRRFRDQFLAKHWLGRRFIDAYYAVSPRAVSLFGEKKWFNSFFKGGLDRFVSHLQKKGYEKTPYED